MLTINQLEFIKYVEIVAEGKAQDAGFSGEMGDGGAGRLRDTIVAWKHGLEGTIPPPLTKYYQDFERSKDPDYQKFLELKKRFE